MDAAKKVSMFSCHQIRKTSCCEMRSGEREQFGDAMTHLCTVMAGNQTNTLGASFCEEFTSEGIRSCRGGPRSRILTILEISSATGSGLSKNRIQGSLHVVCVGEVGYIQ